MKQSKQFLFRAREHLVCVLCGHVLSYMFNNEGWIICQTALTDTQHKLQLQSLTWMRKVFNKIGQQSVWAVKHSSSSPDKRIVKCKFERFKLHLYPKDNDSKTDCQITIFNYIICLPCREIVERGWDCTNPINSFLEPHTISVPKIYKTNCFPVD